MNYSNLENFCYFVKDKINVDKLNNNNYISTENMLPNKGGKTKATKIPNTKTTQAYNKNDILVSNIRPYFKKIWKANTIGGCSNDVLVFRANTEVSPEFLFYVLSNDTFFNYSMSTSKGTKMPRGDKKALMQYKVPNLEYNMQKKIASILSALDDKIELNNKINNNLEEMAQAIFKSWFVDFEPWGGEMPEDWEYGNIEALSKQIICGKTPPTKIKEYYGKDIPFITIPDMHDNTYIINTQRYLSKKGCAYQSKKTLPKNTICVSCIGSAGLVSLTSEDSQTNQQINSIIPKSNISPYFVYFLLKSYYHKINAHGASGSTFCNLNKSQFSKLECIIPNGTSLSKFNRFAKPIFDKILNNNKQNKNLTKLRDTLLPKLMSGELDVSNLEF